ncbi:MAG: terminase large subunit [Dehalococcoidales bacterium]|nr:terminase large subunit [Dehalococcoidales bacterium]
MRKRKAETEAAARAVFFLENLTHTKGQWAGQKFNLLSWQRKLLNDVFGTLNKEGYRRYRTVYCEIPKKNGKSEFCAGVMLKLSFADGEAGAEVYSAAADQHQASIVFDIARAMVGNSPELHRRCDVLTSTKTIYIPQTNSYYKALSSESYTKHGYNVHGLGFDEFHAQPNRDLYDVLTKGSGAARRQPLHFFITTAGNNINSIGYELHEYAKGVLSGDIIDPTFYAVIHGLEPEDDWEDEKNWYKANPSLGEILDIEEFKKAYQDAKRNLAEENIFKQLRLNIWVKQSTRWMRMEDWDACGEKPEELKGWPCYAGLDLSSSIDLTALQLVFPRDGFYDIVSRFWIPEATAEEKEKKDRVPYREWAHKGLIQMTPGNVIDYAYIREELKKLKEIYKIRELAYDRWGASKLIQDLQEDGFVIDPKNQGENETLIVPFGQGYASMSSPTKELMTLVLQRKIRHGGNPVLRWNVDNLVIEQDAAGNIKPNKAKSTQKIDGAVAMIMGIDRAIKHAPEQGPSIYETQGIDTL